MKFEDLNLLPSLLKALRDQKYTEPTSIQEKAIPLILAREDVLGSAQTGTGKTAAFALPIIQHLEQENTPHSGKRKIRVLVVTPTRELAIQIADSFTTYAKYNNVKNTVIYGGVKQGSQTEALGRGVDVLVATPGRLLDLMNQGFISLKDVGYFVLDEADEMLNMGFYEDITAILSGAPKEKNTWLFSATMPSAVAKIAKKFMMIEKR